MKKILLCSLIALASLGKAQTAEDKLPKHEVRINATNLIIYTAIDIAYEYLINAESSVGTATFVFINVDDENPTKQKLFSITPYYKRYFNSKHSDGLYIEAFGMYHISQRLIFNDATLSDHYVKQNNIALGFSTGYKLVSNGSLVVDTYLGIGRNLIKEEVDDYVFDSLISRGGISVGWRF